MHPLLDILARLSITHRGSATLLGWTFLLTAALGLFIVLRKVLSGEPLGQWGRHSEGAPISLGVALSLLVLIALLAGLFLYHGRVGGVPRWLLHASLGVGFVATLGLPFIDEFRHRGE